MGDANDFTFAQVGPQQDEDLLESPKSIPNISAIAIDGNNSTDTTFNKNNNSSVKYSSLDSAKSKSSTIIDLLSPKFKASGSLEKVSIGDSVNGSQEPKIAVRKPAVRVKVPFEKGYSQMDWLKLTQTDPDLAGLKGQSNRRLISMDEVKQHKTEGSIWTVLKGHVYNISPYMKFHPGGVDMLMKAAGKDCTSLFNKYHAWVNAEFLLEKCLVGILDDSR